MKKRLQGGLVSLALAILSVPAVAMECVLKKAPSMCSAIAQDSVFWIGDYFGEEISFRMELEGEPFDPPGRKTEGELTLFELSGRLGFSGGGYFEGEAELQSAPSGYIDPLNEESEWQWVYEDRIVEFVGNMQWNQRNYDDCAIDARPRWIGTFDISGGQKMTLWLVGASPHSMIGRVYFSGIINTQKGPKEALLDSRFYILKDAVDTSDWSIVPASRDRDLMCEMICKNLGSYGRNYGIRVGNFEKRFYGFEENLGFVAAESCAQTD